MTVQEPTPIRPPTQPPWLERAWEAVNACIEPDGSFGCGWEGRYYDRHQNGWGTILLEFAPAFARAETDDDRNGRLVWDPIDIVDVSELSRLLGPRSTVHVTRHREEGLRVTGEGRLFRRLVTVVIRMDEPFDDARPRQIAFDKGGRFGFADLDEDDDGAR